MGRLKKEGALLIVQGGCIESTGRPSPTAERLRILLEQLHGGSRELEAFSESDRQIIMDYSVKRGNANEPFRVDERVARSFKVASGGMTAIEHLAKEGVAEEVSQLSPELLKDGSWRPSGSENTPSISVRRGSLLGRSIRTANFWIR